MLGLRSKKVCVGSAVREQVGSLGETVPPMWFAYGTKGLP